MLLAPIKAISDFIGPEDEAPAVSPEGGAAEEHKELECLASYLDSPSAGPEEGVSPTHDNLRLLRKLQFENAGEDHHPIRSYRGQLPVLGLCCVTIFLVTAIFCVCAL